MAKNVPKLMINTKPQNQEALRAPSRINVKTFFESYSNCRKPKTNRKSWKNHGDKNVLPIDKQGKEYIRLKQEWGE